MDFVSIRWVQNNRYKVLLTTAVALVLLYRFGFFSLLLLVVALLTGYFCALLIFNYAGETIYWDIAQLLQKKRLREEENKVKTGRSARFEKGINNEPPWQDLLVPDCINEALEELIEQILDNYVNSWYKADISGNAAFVDEIRYQIRFAGSLLLRKVLELDLPSLILSEAVPVAVVHCERIVHIERKLDKKVLTPQMTENRILEGMQDIHYALTSRQNEVNYLRQVADYLIASYVDETRIAGHSSDNDSPFLSVVNRQWPSRACHHFLRELTVFSFLLPLLDLIADPDTINRLLILLFEPSSLSNDLQPKANFVSFLHSLTDSVSGDVADSLLQLKLSEVLRDMRQLQMFSMYLKDVRGPVNELYFLLHSGDVRERMLNVQKEDESALSEVHYDAWEIFRKYVHEGAPHKIGLPADVFGDFQIAVEKKDVEHLDKALEKAYQLVYRHLQRDCLLPFCQSECYFGHLCGSSPVSVDDLIASENGVLVNGHSTVAESSFSLSQFRRRLWKVIMPPSTDGSIESLEQLNDVDFMQGRPSSRSIEVANEASLSVRTPVSDSFSLASFEKLLDNRDEADESESGICVVRGSSEPVLETGSATDPQLFAASCDLPIFDLERDMNRWVVTIPHIESRRDPNTGKNMFVYVVCIERFDFPEPSDDGFMRNELRLNKWSVIRRYNEFFILESKLMEFHGVLLKTQPLPPRRPFSRKTREFIESHRMQFQRFLQLLTQQVLLRRSDLLFAFLTSEQEFRDNIQLSGLNPWNMVRKVPSKFSRERGQNLRPFLLSLMANTLAVQPKCNGFSSNNPHNSEFSETSLSSTSSRDFEGVSRPRLLLINSIFGDNFAKLKASVSDEKLYHMWTRSLSESLLLLFNEVFSVTKWIFAVFSSVWSFAGSSLDLYITFLLRKVLNEALVDSNCVRIIRLIQESLFGGDLSPTSEQEKLLRTELALRRTLEYLEDELPSHLLKAIGTRNFRHGTSVLFHALQYPRLNKQLSYVLLDILVQKLVALSES